MKKELLILLSIFGMFKIAKAQTNSYPTPYGQIQVRDNTSSPATFAQGSETYAYFGNHGYIPIAFGNASDYKKMVILDNGNVGIGLINPKSKLDIGGQLNSFNVGLGQQDVAKSSKNYANFGSNNHGTVLISSNLYVYGDDNLKIANSHPTMAGASILIPGNLQPNQGGIVFYTNQPTAVIENANFSGTMSMIIKNDGNVGIGTVTPREKLSVNGKIRAQEIKVEVTGWPDYVFAKDYKLPSLQETEQHIKDKGHLPGIPSAEEVKTKGVDLGEMNAKLLRKIEELTLHLIEKDKKEKVQQLSLDSQNDAIKKLTSRLDSLERKSDQ